MAITKSAKKAQRVAERRTVYNLRRKKALKDILKQAGKLVSAKKGKEAESLMPQVSAAVDKAVKGRVLAKNAAARIKSKLTKRIRAIS
jgi:small subunit ribosomal protein S20